MKSLLKVLRYVRPYRRQAVLAMLFILSVSATDLVAPRLTQRIIDDGLAAGDVGVIATTSLLMIGAAILGAILAIGNTLLSVRVSQGFGTDVRSALVRKVQTFSFGNLDELQTGQLVVRATSDINQVQMMVLMTMRMFVRAPVWVVGSVIMLALGSPKLAWLMAILIPLLFVLMMVFARHARPLFAAVQKRLDRLNKVLQENLAGVRVVKAFVRVDHENARFDEANDAYMDQSIRVGQFIALLIPTVFFVLNLATVAAVWFGGVYVINDELTVGQLIAAINYISRSLFPLVMLGAMIGPLSAADASAARIFEVLDSEPEVQDRAPAQGPAPWPRAEGGARVAFEGVTFSYNGHHAEDVLCDVNLVAEPGQEVAILGATGSGKSSLIHLIPRFYDVAEGRVTLDGVDVRDMPLDALRAQIGISLQEAVLFSGTVRDNISYGRPDATDEEIVAAAMAAQAHEFISALPDGYAAQIGQRGVNLSGGQKQRIAIARALLVQPRVLILDDSTSSVDVETETKLQEALSRLMKGRTSFVIAQRISTVLNADKIVVLDRGRVAAEGTHEELITTSPIYREIYDSQLGDGGQANG